MTADASGVGVGAVISHLTPDGERPVAYASRSLSATERAYAQIDREALAIVYGIRKFHQYLYGRKFTLRTDHKPLTYILGNKAGIPIMAASRLQRWAVLLSGYNYDIEYVASHKNCADALSRLPQTGFEQTRAVEKTYMHFVEQFLPITNKDVKVATSKDTIMRRVMSYVQTGWQNVCKDDAIRPFHNKRNELYIDRGCLMWGYRLVIPQSLREKVLRQLHMSHMGIVKTKSIARSYVWWPNIDADLEAVCKQCETCAAEAQMPSRAPPKPWPYHTQPWSRIHIDFLGPLNGKTYLVLVDASSKWLEYLEAHLHDLDCQWKSYRTRDPRLRAVSFRSFLNNNGIQQSFSPAYHPASNGAAENAVKLCKQVIKKANRESIDTDAALQTFLLSYRNSIHSSTGDTPAMLLQRRPLRSRLDLLRSDSAREQSVRRAQHRQLQNAGGVIRALAPGEPVWARGFSGPDKWHKGTVVGSEGSRRYIVDSGDGRLMYRHVDQVKRRSRMSDVPCPGKESYRSEEAGGHAEVTAEAEVAGETEDGVLTSPAGEGLISSECSSSTQQSEPNLAQPPFSREGNIVGCGSKIRDLYYMECSKCKQTYDLVCINIDKDHFKDLSHSYKENWLCPSCVCSRPKGDNTSTPVRSPNNKCNNVNTLRGSRHPVTKPSTTKDVPSTNIKMSKLVSELRQLRQEVIEVKQQNLEIKKHMS
ncbi:uncharacterized protein K02A2.6-like [Hyposmocoma kahamanoa]|uniref:uncharacterized protein K02A2.6-like n=1 Tax=Hyposmocoma kahamanoa TaxID=1477025 RepID=UPI000E6D7956|nr:uncharacterized protein K02A2.6-like [Hyposmocoma kahamanoa]